MLRRTRDYIGRPAVFFQEQLRGAPDWWLALAAPILCSCLLGIGATVLNQRARRVQIDLLRHLDVPVEMLPPPLLTTVAVMLGYPAWFGMALLALLAINVLCKDEASPTRLTELTGLCFLTQVPLCLITVAVALVYQPEPFQPPAGVSRAGAVAAFVEGQEASPALVLVRTLSHSSALWLASQLAVALKVAGQLSTRAAVVAALFLALLFVGMQLAIDLLGIGGRF